MFIIIVLFLVYDETAGQSFQSFANETIGQSCFQDGVLGTCTLLGKCQSVINNPKSQWWRLNRCGFKGIEPIICCVESATTTNSTTTTARTVATTPRLGTTTIEYVTLEHDYQTSDPQVGGCPALAPERTAEKTGRKAWDKCIEYQQQLVYPCEPGEAWSEDIMIRGNHCHHYYLDLLGGVDARRNEFPHMVLLGYGQSNGLAVWQCSGTLLSDRFILTAGRCTSARDVGPVNYAIVGTLKQTDDVSSSQVHRIRRIIRHPLYKAPFKYNDIALLETESPISLDHTTVPACLDVFGGDSTQVVATGWSDTSRLWHSSSTLKKVSLTRIKDEECRAKFPRNRYMRQGFNSTTQVCYGDYTLSDDICQGDSGGPLTIRNDKIHCMYVVVGVTSFRNACGKLGQPGIYTKLAPYVPWIESIVYA